MSDVSDPSLNSLREALELNSRLFLNCLDGIDDEVIQRRLSGKTNNMAFIGCHMVDSRYFLAGLLGADVDSCFEGRLDYVTSIEEAPDLPGVEEIRAAWLEISGVVVGQMSSLSLSDYAAKVPHKLPIRDRTTRGALVFLLGHESFHLGQLALLRKQFGLGAMRWLEKAAGND